MKISDFQELMKTLYYHQDSKRGKEKTFIWLVEEMGELASLLKDKITDNKSAIGEEMADIIAWTCSLANLMNINLEKELLKKYPGKCVKSNSNPCICEQESRGR